MLQAFGLAYEPSPLAGELFHNVNLTLDPGEVVVLVGKNGIGKTKLIEILAGLVEPKRGRVVDGAGCAIGYLPQDVDLDFAGSLREFLAEDADAAHAAAMARACARLGLDPDRLDQAYASLSVGERVRAALARVLLDEPTVLLLDEPTNHLDLPARQWLVRFLKSARQAVLMVCHDRAVANEVADRVLELAGGELHEYAGGYDDMLEAKRLRDARLREAYERQTAEERRLKNAVEKTLQEAARMTRKPTGRTYDPKHKAFYAGKEAKLDRRARAIRSRAELVHENRVEKPFEEDAASLAFPTRPLRYFDALNVRDLRKAYGERLLFDRLSFTLERGERLAVLGPNGAGKTTLFRILLGEEAPDAGEARWATDAQPAFLSQDRAALDRDRTVLEALDPAPDRERFVRTVLARLRIRGDAVHKPMRALSVGERTKVELASLLMTPANVLLLDEPTNHLDVDSLEALEEALREFPGSVLFTSHDRAFIERTANGVVTLL